MKHVRIFKNAKPLWWYTDTVLIVCKKKSFYFLDVEKNEFEKIANLPEIKIIQRFIIQFRFLRRLFRMEPSCFTNFCNDQYLFCFNSSIYCIDLKKKEISREFTFREGLRKTLSICTDGKNAFFGEYWTGNNKFHNVKIYRRRDGVWESCYTFDDGQIRHIHKLLIFHKDLYCFTGDEISETKIVRFKNLDFSKPEIVYSNSQIYRTCCVVASENNIFYTTDTPYEDNKFISINIDNNDFTILNTLESSSIYSSNISNHYFYFSTVVEPNLIKKNGINKRIKITRNLGGIHSNISKLYLVNVRNNSLLEVFKLKKDILPFLFGLGTFIPVPNNSSVFVAAYSSCLKKDGATIVFKLADNNLN